MKKLSKLVLKEKAELLNNQELKGVVGGYGGYGWCCFSDGECVLSGCTSNSHCTTLYGEGECRQM
jgi:hypothetical protein